MHLDTTPPPQAMLRRSGRASRVMQNKTVLVIDDEPDQREIYRVVLRHAGYRILEAADAVQGILLARTHLPDLILLDIALPSMDGWEAARQLKAYPTTADIPICAVSARLLPPHEQGRVEAAGLACYLLKPVEPRVVLREVLARIGPADSLLEQERRIG